MGYKQILVATETLTNDVEMTNFLKEIALYNNAKLCLLRAFETISPFGLAYSLPSVLLMEHQLREMAKQDLEIIAKQVNFENQEKVIEMGRTADVLIEKAREMKADLIILGNDKRHLIAATAASVLQHAPCDILAINS